ncbi:MAG: acyl-ACP--UDP-N-acetylglucosamine O-acyltransferase [Rickettsiales bacterium]|jgi:UDP-N-acetylglucosamine acyltransferase|nr:acyl-ACP--UDP-N-acetylglucosamine O-acyltransferase [Rickettsiales bacterium]
MDIHETAVVEKGAQVAKDVKIGAYSYVGENVRIGEGTVIMPNVIIKGNTEIGENNTIFSFAVIGEVPQDLKFKGEDSRVEIGDNNSIREHCTIHLGTSGGGMVTKVGNGNLLMVNTHIAHDCILGDNNIIANNATFAGHVIIGDNVHVGGLSATHQFVRFGNGSMLGGMSALGEDLIPWGMAYSESGRRSNLQGLNLVGLKRAGYSKKDISDALKFYKEVFESDGSIVERAKEFGKKYEDNKIVSEIANFMGENTDRQFCGIRQK